jgi:hypothetical protein
VAGATRAGKRLASFTFDSEARFASAADRAAFAEELATAVTTLVRRYYDDNAPGAQSHRIVLTVHPHIEHIEREERSSPAS